MSSSLSIFFISCCIIFSYSILWPIVLVVVFRVIGKTIFRRVSVANTATGVAPLVDVSIVVETIQPAAVVVSVSTVTVIAITTATIVKILDVHFLDVAIAIDLAAAVGLEAVPAHGEVSMIVILTRINGYRRHWQILEFRLLQNGQFAGLHAGTGYGQRG